MIERVFHIDELGEVAGELLAYAGDRKKIVFSGDLGAGKTTLIKAICRQLGVGEAVTSPTYALVNEYATTLPPFLPIYHFDLYRLKDLEEALDIGIEEYLYDNTSYCFIEWPEVISSLLPADIVKVELKIIKDSARKILYL